MLEPFALAEIVASAVDLIAKLALQWHSASWKWIGEAYACGCAMVILITTLIFWLFFGNWI